MPDSENTQRLAFVNEENAKLAAELIIANKELVFQNREKERRADELYLANKELAFQNSEKESRAEELIIANKELAYQNAEKGKRAAELFIANKELVFQNREKEKRADELVIANKELLYQNEEKEKRATELIKANKELEQQILLNRDKDLFISILAHDLRSPFTAFLGLSEILKDEVRKLDIGQVEEIAINIHKTALNTFNLLEDILMWTRIQQGRIPFYPKTLNLADIVDDVLKILNPNAEVKSITISYMPENLVNIFADPDTLKTVLRNLVSNAIKFTNIHGSIKISASENSDSTTVSVSDNGIGIIPEDQKKLFDMSQVLTTMGTANETGTGLGLLLCKEFIERHNGRICVESEYGKGSEFRITLPKIDV